MGLAAIKKAAAAAAPIQDEEDSGMPDPAIDLKGGDDDNDTVKPSASPAASAAPPARRPPPPAASPVTEKPSDADEDSIDAFSALADKAASENVSRASAPPAPSQSLADALDANLPRETVTPIFAQSPASSPAAPADPVPSGSEAGNAEDSPVPLIDPNAGQEPASRTSGLVDQQIAFNLLSSSGLEAAEAARIAQDYLSDVARDVEPFQKDLDARTRREEELMKRYAEMEAAHRHGGSQNLFGALISGIGNLLSTDPRRRSAKRMSALAEDRERLDDLHRDKIDHLRDRIFSAKQRQYQTRVLEMAGGANAVARAVKAYNETVVGSSAAAPFKEALEAYAADREIDLGRAVSDFANGQAPAAVLEAYQSVEKSVLADPSVKAASQAIEKTRGELDSVRKGAVNDAEVMAQNFPQKFDAETSQKHLVQAMEQIAEKMPKPVSEEERKKMDEAFQKAVDAIKEAFQRLFDRLLALVSGPRA